MSMSALLRGVATRLRSTAVFNDQPAEPVGKLVSIQNDGNPPNNFGQFAVVVHPLTATVDDPNAQTWSVMYAVGVTVTARLGYAPKDRRGARITNTGDILDRALEVARALHQDDQHRLAANALITGEGVSVNGFLTPLKVVGIDPPRKAPPGWGGLTDTNDVFTATVRLGDAHRIQTIGG